MNTDTMVWNFTKQVNMALDTARFQRTEITFDEHWKMRFHKSTHSIQVVVTFGWLNETDNRWTRCTKQSQWDLTEGTGNLIFQWMMRTVDRVQPK